MISQFDLHSNLVLTILHGIILDLGLIIHALSKGQLMDIAITNRQMRMSQYHVNEIVKVYK